MNLGMFPQKDPKPADWDKIPALSPHLACVLLQGTPLRAWQESRLLGGGLEPQPTDAKDRGTILHQLILGGRTKIEVVDAPDFKTKLAQIARDKARDEGKVPVLQCKLDEYNEAVEALRPQLAGVLAATEVRCAWMSDGDVLCHGFIDSFKEHGPYGIEGIDDSRPLILDPKFVDDAVDGAAANHFYDMGYHVKGAAYLDCVQVLRPDLPEAQMVFALCEYKPPYDVRFVPMAESFRELGIGQWNRAVYDWRKCMTEGKWPGSGRQVHPVEAPIWAVRREGDVVAKRADASMRALGSHTVPLFQAEDAR